MDRRRLFTAAAMSIAVGSGAEAHGTAAVASTAARRSPTRVPANTVETTDGTQLFYRSWGKGRPIVFVAAWALHSQAWQYQMVPLADKGFRCVAFDRRGHGRSSDPGTGYDLDTLADDLGSVIAQLDLTDVILVAHSLGAAESVRYLTRHGTSRIARLVLIAPTTPCLTRAPDNPDGLDPSVFAGMRAAFAADFPGIVANNIQPFVNPETSSALTQWIMRMMSECSLQALIDCNRNFAAADFRGEMPALRLPTLIVKGDADASAPLELTGRKTVALMPHATLTVYEGAPHGLIFTHKTRLNGDLVDFARS
jgi:non-heme chloroperoxidase